MQIFGSIPEPPTENLNSGITDHGQRGPVGPKPVCYDRIRSAITFHGTLQKGERRLTISPLRSKDLKHFTFVIDRAPEVKHLAINADKNFAHMPTPLRIASMLNTTFPDFGREHRTETVPSLPHSLVANINTAFEQDVLDLA